MAGITSTRRSPPARPPDFVQALSWVRTLRAAQGKVDSPETDAVLGRVEALLDGIMLPQVQEETLHTLWQVLVGVDYLIRNTGPEAQFKATAVQHVHDALKVMDKFWASSQGKKA